MLYSLRFSCFHRICVTSVLLSLPCSSSPILILSFSCSFIHLTLCPVHYLQHICDSPVPCYVPRPLLTLACPLPCPPSTPAGYTIASQPIPPSETLSPCIFFFTTLPTHHYTSVSSHLSVHCVNVFYANSLKILIFVPQLTSEICHTGYQSYRSASN